MKKTAIAILILLIPIIANAEGVIKVGTSVLYGNVEGHKFTMFSAELKYEQSIWKNFGLGFGLRKETRWGYSGYYLSLYPKLTMPLSKKTYLVTSIGAEYGIASSDYDYYSRNYDQGGNLIAQKWIYLIQNAPIPFDKIKGNTGILYPLATISCGTRIWKRLVIEMGLKIQMLKFGIKSCSLDHETWQAYNIVDKKIWVIIPSLVVQIGYRL